MSLQSPRDPAAVGAELRRLNAGHSAARRRLLRNATDVIHIADALAWLASDAYQLANRLADAAGAHGAAIGRLRLYAKDADEDTERQARQRPLARKLATLRVAA
jgi:hypothetical protein